MTAYQPASPARRIEAGRAVDVVRLCGHAADDRHLHEILYQNPWSSGSIVTLGIM